MACIREGRQPHNDAAAGLRVVRLLEAASQSLRAGGARVAIGATPEPIPCA